MPFMCSQPVDFSMRLLIKGFDVSYARQIVGVKKLMFLT